MKRFNRVLCRIAAITDSENYSIELGLDTAILAEIDEKIFPSNYGDITIEQKSTYSTDFKITLGKELAQKLGIGPQDFLELVHLDNALFLIPISSQNLIPHFFNVSGAPEPRIIILSSHPDFESYTREIATAIHQRLQEQSIPSLRIEPRERVFEGIPKLDLTISRFDVDITRNQQTPELIGDNMINKNPSYRIIAESYFRLLSQVLYSQAKQVVIDFHGIANASSRGVIHPMVLVGDAFTETPLIKNFVKTIEKLSRAVLPHLWIPYRSQWGSVEYSLQLVKNTANIPIIIEIRSDLREDSEIRSKLIDLITRALINLVEQISAHNIAPPERITYRPFQPPDLNQILLLYMKSFSWLYGAQVHTYATQFITLFQEAFNEGSEGEMFVAEQEGIIIGFAVIHKEPSNDWKFGPIAVLPSFQHEGIGSYLLQLCIEFAQSKKVKSFYLKVHEHNYPAIKLYKKFGFTVTEIIPSPLTDKNLLKMMISV
jgi:ribosomal protein S18 acetylase RimI-like enzyme